MDQLLEFVPRCSRHSKSMGEGPQCFSKCREEVEVALAAQPATVAQGQAKPKQKTQAPLRSPKADAGRIGGASTSPAKTAAAKVNGARGGRPRKVNS